MNERQITPTEPETKPEADAPLSEARRDAVTKIAYASPVLASLLFAGKAQSQNFSPPAPPR